VVRKRPTVCHVLHSLKVGGAAVLAARLARQFCGDFRVLFACLDELGTLGQQLRAVRHRMGQQGRERVVALFSEQQMHDSYRQVYQERLRWRQGP
jgi:hypothetical protein